jgi:DNA-binding LacI/PurR family transcriptional regulator
VSNGDGRLAAEVSMREVAVRAGVSPATVSRVLNGAPTVREDYRTRVLAAVAELDYRPNRLARNLRRRQAEMVGVVVSDIENPHFSEMVRAIEDEAFGAGFRVLLCNTDENAEKQRAYLEMLADERALGVVISPSDPAGEEIGDLLDLGIPVVALDRMADDPRADAVVADNVDAARQATTWLIDAGHEHIGLVAGRVDVETGDERLEGYTQAMRAAGLPELVAGGGFRLEGGHTAAAELLAGTPRPTGLVVANNLMTIGALRALRAAGLRIPDDVALTAIDDPFWAEFTDPSLTTLAQPVREMANAAMTMLLERIEGRTEPKRLMFPFELKVRASCGRRPATSKEEPWPESGS